MLLLLWLMQPSVTYSLNNKPIKQDYKLTIITLWTVFIAYLSRAYVVRHLKSNKLYFRNLSKTFKHTYLVCEYISNTDSMLFCLYENLTSDQDKKKQTRVYNGLISWRLSVESPSQALNLKSTSKRDSHHHTHIHIHKSNHRRTD